ncbi:MAG: radical SAM protein [Planctomycetes bacterium]|nr:radical SAM protein [Planctomycetota bacterium]
MDTASSAARAVRPANSFAALPGIGWRMPRVSRRWLWFWRIVYRGLAAWRHLRIQRWTTRLLGPQYVRSRKLIEIDITYLCNLHCLNCNRSVGQARESLHMAVAMVEDFVANSLTRGVVWRRIRVLGGEPTLHPEFDRVIEVLRGYTKVHPGCILEVVTNGYGEHVEAALDRLPEDVWVDNSRKTGRVQPTFGPFNLAPCDDPRYRNADYANACAVARDCGMGLTPLGYYPCAVAGGIDRILGGKFGRQALPGDQDDLLAEASTLCRLCGRFRDGHFVPRVLRPALTTELVSPTWRRLYADWHGRHSTP